MSPECSWPEVSRALVPVAESLRSASSIAVVGHVDPDLDSIGSVLALSHALWRAGKACVPVTPDPDPDHWHFLPGHERLVAGLPEGLPVDTVIVLDTDLSPERVGRAWPLVESARVRLNVDHHPTNNRAAERYVVEPRAAATGELIFYLVESLGVPITLEIATCLYAAVMTDTGSFRFSNTSARTFSLAARWVAAGVDPHDVATRVFDARSWAFMRLLGEALSRMQQAAGGRVAWLSVTREMAEQAGIPPSEVEGLVQYPRMVEGVEVALLFKEIQPGKTRVSLRSQRFVDVATLARRFGGGGHLRAAGCTIDMPLAGAEQVVVEACVSAVEDVARSAASPDGQGRVTPASDLHTMTR